MQIEEISLSKKYDGTLVELQSDYGFIAMDDYFYGHIFFHKDSCRLVKFESLRVPDRVRFFLERSRKYPSTWCAVNMRLCPNKKAS